MLDVDDPENAVRNYLLYLENPAQLVDAARVGSLEQAVACAIDPIERLKALASLARARTPDADSYERAFVQHARAWAVENAVPAATFKELGVSERVLRDAGFAVAGRPKAADVPSKPGRSVSAKEIQRQILTRGMEKFTLADIAQTIGGSPMTVRKAVDELVRTGDLIRLGPTPGWPGPGRAPIQFAKS